MKTFSKISKSFYYIENFFLQSFPNTNDCQECLHRSLRNPLFPEEPV